MSHDTKNEIEAWIELGEMMTKCSHADCSMMILHPSGKCSEHRKVETNKEKAMLTVEQAKRLCCVNVIKHKQGYTLDFCDDYSNTITTYDCSTAEIVERVLNATYETYSITSEVYGVKKGTNYQVRGKVRITPYEIGERRLLTKNYCSECGVAEVMTPGCSYCLHCAEDLGRELATYCVELAEIEDMVTLYQELEAAEKGLY